MTFYTIKFKAGQACLKTMLLFFLISSSFGVFAISTGPKMNLFPTSVIESLKQTSESAKQMENDLTDIIETLNRQGSLFKQSKCEGASMTDQGCRELKKAMIDTYMSMLDEVENQLPAMKRSFNETIVTIEKKIKDQIGLGLTPRGIQRMVAGKSGITRLTKDRQGKRAGRMSGIFAKWHNIISRNRSAGSVPTLAASVYLDAVDSQSYIGLLEDEINVARLEAVVTDTFSGITPEMENTIQNVKSLIYGEIDSPMAIAPVVAGVTDPNIHALAID